MRALLMLHRKYLQSAIMDEKNHRRIAVSQHGWKMRGDITTLCSTSSLEIPPVGEEYGGGIGAVFLLPQERIRKRTSLRMFGSEMLQTNAGRT